ncbi:coiled-coil domain-containing protein 175 [Parambassis ranga]|uniref:Coiled-coil domain-containing protein 175 n=1 Tax=Parambassis ranga TaxID=210632 RepID=A0A6P7JK87_9TELE|nr:coiled-coil domain-containing protein 175-like [Parambassis ranga]
MAACLVRDFPAVVMALEHLQDLDKQLREERVPFEPEASLHLTEITAAITQLEADRRVAHELLEVETIENSKLRHQHNDLRERMIEDIMADVAATRASNAEEIEQLRKDLSATSQLLEEATKRQTALLNQNQTLQPERRQVRAEHGAIIAALNDQITLKYSLQMRLDQTRGRIEELKSCIAAVEQEKITLQQNMALEREAVSVKKDNLSREAEQAEEVKEQQEEAIRRSRNELDRVHKRKQNTQGRLNELMVHMARLENNTQRLTASRRQCEKQLEGESQRRQALRQQRETLKKNLCDLKKEFAAASQHLQGQISKVEGEIEEGRASRTRCQDALAQIYEVFRRQHAVESEERAEHLHVSQQLERTRLRLEERIASIVRRSQEIKEMDRRLRELLETNTVNRRVFEKDQEELCDHMDTEKKNVGHLEEEKDQLSRLLKVAKSRQEEHVRKTTSDIDTTRRRYEELQQEEAELQQRQPSSVDADLLMNHVTQSVLEYRQTESMQGEEIQRCTAEADGVTKSTEEKQREVEEKEEVLKEVEATWTEKKSRHESLTALTGTLEERKAELQLSIEELKKSTSALLQPKLQKKTELEELRGSHAGLLHGQASELRAVEASIYNSSVYLEQVCMENSRLCLCIRQMTEDVSRAREHKGRYQREARQVGQDAQSLYERLREAWRHDLALTEDCQSSDGAILASMSSLMKQVETRRRQLGNACTLLHQQMLDFSQRLGDKTMKQTTS